jgi:hypothetical protein
MAVAPPWRVRRGRYLMETGRVTVKRSVCLVDFCRNGCPTLPDDATVERANGFMPCERCGAALDRHPTEAYPSGLKHVVRDCAGRYWHL